MNVWIGSTRVHRGILGSQGGETPYQSQTSTTTLWPDARWKCRAGKGVTSAINPIGSKVNPRQPQATQPFTPPSQSLLPRKSPPQIHTQSSNHQTNRTQRQTQQLPLDNPYKTRTIFHPFSPTVYLHALRALCGSSQYPGRSSIPHLHARPQPLPKSTVCKTTNHPPHSPIQPPCQIHPPSHRQTILPQRFKSSPRHPNLHPPTHQNVAKNTAFQFHLPRTNLHNFPPSHHRHRPSLTTTSYLAFNTSKPLRSIHLIPPCTFPPADTLISGTMWHRPRSLKGSSHEHARKQ